jgi:hypothetical protein
MKINFDSATFLTRQLHTPADNSADECPGDTDVIDLVTVSRFCELSGYTDDAVRAKLSNGVWLEGQVWFKAPDGRILISISGYEAWGRGSKRKQ